jgi:hypothetical protein
MTRDNMPNLYKNIMDSLPNDFSRDVFLWAVERPGEDRMCYRAERFAREAELVLESMTTLIDVCQYCGFLEAARGKPSRLLSEDQRADLISYAMLRHANWRYAGNLRPEYAERIKEMSA